MSTPLHRLIARQIEANGPMDLGAYMALCLGHPQHGYYMTRDPFGKGGDFTTAPEISQMFGELIGAWIADVWMKLGSPSSFALIECGPGRGTLMEDALRATRSIPGFHQALKLHLMEMSPVLRNAQAQRLGQYDPVWITALDEVLPRVPVIVLGNEFLDALPIRHLRFDKVWQEKVIAFQSNDTLSPGWKEADAALLAHVPSSILTLGKPDVFECSPAIDSFLSHLSNLLRKQSGAALFIDYGHAQTAVGETFQAVREHRFENPFENPGECDLTAHVDFENIARSAEGLSATPVVTQAQFLTDLGIEARATALKAKADPRQAADIDAALARLTAPDQMGTLFKVIALCHDASIQLAGF